MKYGTKVAIRVHSGRGLVTLYDGTFPGDKLDLQVVPDDTLNALRAGTAKDHMEDVKVCHAFTDELTALLDRYGVERFATEVLT